MSIIYCKGNDAPQSGSRIIRSDSEDDALKNEGNSNGYFVVGGPIGSRYFARASSTEIAELVLKEAAAGRLTWAQLTIEIDDIRLSFGCQPS